ncbi:MAG: hypothetical protein C0482_22125 [Gordonia sp.]|nr:hypothetical protein [Gordonia sp. (in: high G+C Gram-positive bacteria)]
MGINNTAYEQLRDRYDAIGDPVGDLTSMLSAAAEDRPDRTAVGVGNESLSYIELERQATRIAAGLSDLGVKPGDRVAFLAAGSLEMVVAFFATWKLGAIIVPLNAFLKGEPLRHQLSDSGARVVVADDLGLTTVLPILDALPDVQNLVRIGCDPSTRASLGGVACIDFSALSSDPSSAFEPVRMDLPACLMYTSGTTGLPKACILSHRYLHHLGRQCAAAFALQQDDIFYSVSPLYHLTSILPLMASLIHRRTIHFDVKFSASRFLDRCRELDATVLLGVGFYAIGLLRQPPSERDKDHALRVMVLAPLPEEERVQFESRFGVPLINQTYGQTEMSMVTVNPIGMSRDGTAGMIAPWAELAIFDELDQEVGTDVVGQIALRPRKPGTMFDGYWNRPDATAAISKNMWHHTGDYGRVDADGYLTFVGRKSDRMRRRGENVSAYELEAAIVTHPQISEVAVHAIHMDDEIDDTIKVHIVPVLNADLQPESLAEFFTSQLPYFAIPRFVQIAPLLPRNTSGRILKHILAEQANDESTWDLELLGLASAKRRG